MSDTDVDADVHSLTASAYTGVVSADLVACPELSAGRLGPDPWTACTLARLHLQLLLHPSLVALTHMDTHYR